MLDRRLSTLKPLEFTASEQIQEAANRSGKMSIQGVQPKLSGVLNFAEGKLDIVDLGGKFILKPPSESFPELPENESLTMRLASTIGIEVPFNGLLYAKDDSRTYIIKRFDRSGHSKIPLEDFAQLSGASRNTKYDSSMESVIEVLDKFATFPKIERLELFRRTLFNYLTGNEDMHLKNFSLIKLGKRIQFSPAYDLLNTTIALKNAKEELALPLKGKKKNLTKKDFLTYFGKEQLELSDKLIDSELTKLKAASEGWEKMIEESFLSEKMQDRYQTLLASRLKTIF